MTDNPRRQRAPRGFTDGISLKLTGLEGGSAVPVISLCYVAASLFPPAAKPYFDDARAALVGAISEAEQARPVTKLPPSILGYFGRLGSSLEPGEAVEFTDSGNAARLTQESRHRLVIASAVQEYTDNVVFHGTVPELDQGRMSFQVARPDGAIIKVPLAETYSDTILEAVNGYKTGKRVRLHASGLFDRERRLKGIQVVDRVNVIDPLDVRARIEELKLLRDGWLDGSGVAATASSIDRVGAQFEGRYPDDLRPPYLFLTPEGHLLAEWSLKPGR